MNFMQCFKPAWDRGFTKERNLKGWNIEGLIPFNRNAYWCKKGTTTSLTVRASTGHRGVDTGPAAMSTAPADEGEQATS